MNDSAARPPTAPLLNEAAARAYVASLGDDIDLRDLADAIDHAYDEGAPLIVAAVHGKAPSIGFKGSVMVWDSEHLAFWERGLGETFEAIQAGSPIALLYRNPDRGQLAMRFYGAPRIVDDQAVRDDIWQRMNEAEKHRDPNKTGVAVLIQIERVRIGGKELSPRRSAAAQR